MAASGRWLRKRSRPYHPDALYALNFYSPLVADQLRSLRKTATIRLGDKSGKYRKGMIVQVLAGARFGPREKIFDAVIDKIEVKSLGELSPREIEHDNPEIRRTEEMANFLSQLYNREVSEEDTSRSSASPRSRASGSRIASPAAGARSAALRSGPTPNRQAPSSPARGTS